MERHKVSPAQPAWRTRAQHPKRPVEHADHVNGALRPTRRVYEAPLRLHCNYTVRPLVRDGGDKKGCAMVLVAGRRLAGPENGLAINIARPYYGSSQAAHVEIHVCWAQTRHLGGSRAQSPRL